MRRPSFQFYPADWRTNVKLRRCSEAARGAWMDIMCVLHGSDEYGIVHWPLAELAGVAGASLKAVRELRDKGVLKGCDSGTCTAYVYTPRSGRKDGPPVTLVPSQKGPVWYSSRLVRDEYVRTHSGASSRFTSGEDTPPQLPLGGNGKSGRMPDDQLSPSHRHGATPSHRHGDRHGDDQGDGSSSSSSSSKEETNSPTPYLPRENQVKRLSDVIRGSEVGRALARNGGTGSHHVTIDDPKERLAIFQKKLAEHLAPSFGGKGEAWHIVMSAADPGHTHHAPNLQICKQAAKDMGKGWPRAWV